MLSLLLLACSTIHGVKPVGEGNTEVNLSLGGPIAEVFGAPIPIPLSTVGVTYGVTDRLDVHGAFHPTAALLQGVVEAEVGASYQFLPNHGAVPRLMGDLTLLGAGGDVAEGEPKGGFRLYLQPSFTASWDWGKNKRQTTYTALTCFFQPFPTVHAVGAWAVGQRWGMGPRFHLDTELKWIAPYASTLNLVPRYYGIGNQGALSFQLGFGYIFGKGVGS